MIKYEVVPITEVKANLRFAASDALEFCLSDLGIKNRPEIRWITEIRNGSRRFFGEILDQKEPIYGCVRFSNNTIFLNISQSVATVKNTMAHECRHIYQREKLVNEKMPIPIGYDQEIDARAYAQDAERALWYWPGTEMLAKRCTSKGFYIQQEAPQAQASSYQAPVYNKANTYRPTMSTPKAIAARLAAFKEPGNKADSGNDMCQKEGCGRVVFNRRFCHIHALEEGWRFENERLKLRQQMMKQAGK